MNIIIYKPRSKGLGMFEMKVCLTFSVIVSCTHTYMKYMFFGYTYQAVGPKFSKDEQGQYLSFQEGQDAKI